MNKPITNKLNMKNLMIRSLSGIIYVALIVCPIYFKMPGLYVGVFSAFAVLAIREFATLAEHNKTRWMRTILDSIAGAYLFIATLMYVSGLHASAVFLPYVFYILYTFVRNIYSDRATLVEDTSRVLLGQVYVALPLALANLIAFDSVANGFDDMRSGLLLMVFVLIWVNDTFAYLAGISFGKHKLFPSVSPRKTWEGFVGGMTATMAASVFIGLYAIQGATPWYIWAICGLGIGAAATWGDLFESSLKRQTNTKDSGHLIPGHGGILDRIDSALFAIPAAYILYSALL